MDPATVRMNGSEFFVAGLASSLVGSNTCSDDDDESLSDSWFSIIWYPSDKKRRQNNI